MIIRREFIRIWYNKIREFGLPLSSSLLQSIKWSLKFCTYVWNYWKIDEGGGICMFTSSCRASWRKEILTSSCSMILWFEATTTWRKWRVVSLATSIQRSPEPRVVYILWQWVWPYVCKWCCLNYTSCYWSTCTQS